MHVSQRIVTVTCRPSVYDGPGPGWLAEIASGHITRDARRWCAAT